MAILNLSTVYAEHRYAYISKTVLYGLNSTKFWTCWVSLQSSHANFQNIFVSPNIADIFEFCIRRLGIHKNAYILEDRAKQSRLMLTLKLPYTVYG